MKELLLEAYKNRLSEFKKIRTEFADEDMAGPFLMSPNEEYSAQPNPLLIVGQETNGWQYHIDDLTKQMEAYEKFNVGVDYYASPFWNVTRKVERKLGNLPHTCAWTNISKFDHNCGRSYGEYETAIATLDNLLTTEVSILKPKVCIFFTGPSFDKRIQNTFENIEFAPVADFSPRQLSQLKHPGLPALSFRTYHPNYLRRRGLESKFIDFVSGLVL